MWYDTPGLWYCSLTSCMDEGFSRMKRKSQIFDQIWRAGNIEHTQPKISKTWGEGGVGSRYFELEKYEFNCVTCGYLFYVSFNKNNRFMFVGLKRMEEMLNGFQSDLSSISSEIQTLQSQSVAMNVKLKNRQAVRGELSQFVDEMVVPESMIK